MPQVTFVQRAQGPVLLFSTLPWNTGPDTDHKRATEQPRRLDQHGKQGGCAHPGYGPFIFAADWYTVAKIVVSGNGSSFFRCSDEPHSKSHTLAMRPPDPSVRFLQVRAKSSERNKSLAHHLLIAVASCTKVQLLDKMLRVSLLM